MKKVRRWKLFHLAVRVSRTHIRQPKYLKRTQWKPATRWILTSSTSKGCSTVRSQHSASQHFLQRLQQTIGNWLRWKARYGNTTVSQRIFLRNRKQISSMSSAVLDRTAKNRTARRRQRMSNPLVRQDSLRVNSHQRSSQRVSEVITYSVSRSEVVARLNQQLDPLDLKRSDYEGTRDNTHLLEPDELSLFENRVSADSIGSASQNYLSQDALETTETSLEISSCDRISHPRLSPERSCDELMDRAFLAECKGHDRAAEVLYLESLRLHAARSTQVLPGARSKRVRTSKSLAALYFRQQRYQEAEPLLHQTLQLQLQIDAEHELVGEISYLLAQIYQYQQRYAEADELFQRALSVFGQRLGADHPHTQAVYRDLMQLLITSIETDAFEELNAGSTPLDLDNLCEVYSWAKPTWQQ